MERRTENVSFKVDPREIARSQPSKTWKCVLEKYQEGVSHKNDQIPSPLKSTSGLCFDSDQKARILLETFFSGKHLKEEIFDEDFKKSVNDKLKMIEFLKKTEVIELRNLIYNGTISSRELNDVIETVSKMISSPDDEYIHSKMIAMSGPTFGTCLIKLFIIRLSSASWPWKET